MLPLLDFCGSRGIIHGCSIAEIALLKVALAKRCQESVSSEGGPIKLASSMQPIHILARKAVISKEGVGHCNEKFGFGKTSKSDFKL
jgi:hypothetical protein